MTTRRKKKLSVNTIPSIQEVNLIKKDSVIHFNNPEMRASLATNTFAVTGHANNKQITRLLPGILNPKSLRHLKKLASNATSLTTAGWLIWIESRKKVTCSGQTQKKRRKWPEKW